MDAAAVTAAFVDAVVRRDFESLATVFADDVALRALLPRETVEVVGSADAIQRIRGWFEPHTSLEVLEVEQRPGGRREYFAYRFSLKPDWAPDVVHIVEQSGYCKVDDGRITRLDLICSGFAPVS
jgi:hypothetical protein